MNFIAYFLLLYLLVFEQPCNTDYIQKTMNLFKISKGHISYRNKYFFLFVFLLHAINPDQNNISKFF